MASGVVTIRHLLGLAVAVCLAAVGQPGALAQSTKPDAVAIIQTFADTGRSDYRFQSYGEAEAFINAWPARVERWIAAGDRAESERRRYLSALTALEFSRTAFDALTLTAASTLHEALIDSAYSVLRRHPPADFERRWLRTSTSLRPGSYAHLEAAADRFPDDPRLKLNEVLPDGDARTLAHTPGTSEAALLLSLGSGDKDPVVSKKPRYSGRAERVFTELLTDPEVGAEVTARLGWLRFHQSNLTESRRLFDKALSEASDPFVRNLAALGLGLTHLFQGRGDESTTAFRAAHAVLPTARTAITALALQQFLADQRHDASDLLDAVAGVRNTLDPWIHVNGAGRLVDDLLRDMRTQLGVPPRVAPAVTPEPSPTAPPAVTPAPAKAAPPRPPDSAQTRPLFTAITSIVSVDAAVMNGRRPVEGLTAADFEVRDNGVLQAIESVSLEGLPLDVTVVLDMRDSSYAIFRRNEATVVQDATSQGVADTAQFSALLRSDDRLRIVTATRDVSEPHPLQGPDGRAVHRVPREQMTASALYDAIFTALARRTSPERRHIVIVFTDGVDGSSIITSRQLLQAAAKSDALVQVFRRDTADEFFGRSRTGANSNWISRSLLWPHDPVLLPALAEATSGTLERVNSTGQSVVADVKRTLDSFRQRYILRYRPTGVEPGGWHTVGVRVTRPGRLTVQARRGYDGG